MIINKILKRNEELKNATTLEYLDMIKTYKNYIDEKTQREDIQGRLYALRLLNTVDVPFEHLIKFDDFTLLFYITSVENFSEIKFKELNPEQKQQILTKVINDNVLSKGTIDYIGALFSQYAEEMTEQQLRDVTVRMMRLANDNFVVYRILASKLRDLNQSLLLEDVLTVVSYKYGEKAGKEISETLN